MESREADIRSKQYSPPDLKAEVPEAYPKFVDGARKPQYTHWIDLYRYRILLGRVLSWKLHPCEQESQIVSKAIGTSCRAGSTGDSPQMEWWAATRSQHKEGRIAKSRARLHGRTTGGINTRLLSAPKAGQSDQTQQRVQ